MYRLLGVLLVLLTAIVSEAASDQCLIVRSAEGHRFRNSMIAGALTGGIGLAAGAAFSGAKYEYADSFNMSSTKPKYKGKELEELQRKGVHVIVVNKKTASTEMDSARNSCYKAVAPVAPVAAPVPVAAASPAPTPSSTPAIAQSSNTQTISNSEPSLGEAARQAKAQKEQPKPPQ